MNLISYVSSRLYEIEDRYFKRISIAQFFIIAFIILVVILSFRWNYSEVDLLSDIVIRPEFDNPQFDILNYEKLVKYFRGEDVEGGIVLPFRYRIFHPFISSLLPYSARMSLTIVNLLFHLISILYVILILRYYNYSKYEQFLGMLFYIVSYPMLMYGAVGWNEPVALGLLMAGLYHIIKKDRLVLVLIVIMGTLNNEKILLLLIFNFAYEIIITKNYFTFYLVALFVLVQISLIRSDILFENSNTVIYDPSLNYDWKPSFAWLESNLFDRWRTYPGAILTFGLVGTGVIIYIKNVRYKINRELLPYVIGFMASISMFLFNLTIAISSGRILWYIYPFAIPILIYAINKNRIPQSNSI